MSKQTFEERCLLAEQCLPDAPYRAMLKKLHTEMLAKLAEQPASKPWVELTEAEIDEICLGDEAKVRTALQLLKEKNT